MCWSVATPLFFNVIGPGKLLLGHAHGNPCSSPLDADLGLGAIFPTVFPVVPHI